MNKTTYDMGACTYCGQAVSLDREYSSAEEADAAATAICKCAEARAERDLKKEIEAANDKIFRLFGEAAGGSGFAPIRSQETIALMMSAVELVARDHIDSLTINCRGAYKAVISMNSKGKIKVSRSETRIGTLE